MEVILRTLIFRLMQEGFKNLREGDLVQYHQPETDTGLRATDSNYCLAH